MIRRLRAVIAAWLAPGVVPEQAPERIGPFHDESAAREAVHEADERYSDWLNAYLGYFETRQDADGWHAVRVLGGSDGRPASIQRTAGLGPPIG